MASFKSVLATIGSDVHSVFAWLGSAKGQKTIAAAESAIEVVAPQITGIVNLFNSGLTEVIKIEALASAAGAQTGTGIQKSAAVTSAITPTVLAYAQQNGLPAPTATTIQSFVDGLVSAFNALEGK